MKILFINPQSSLLVFKGSQIESALVRAPFLSCASLAGASIESNHHAKVLDLMVSEKPSEDLSHILKFFKPDFVGITFTTPLFFEAKKLVKNIKESNPNIVAIAGGIHASTFPEEALKDASFDIVCIGEGEKTIQDILDGKQLEHIDGIAFMKNGVFQINKSRKLMENIDDLPMPAYHLYDLSRYVSSRITSKMDPVAYMETSRGCPYTCSFCTQEIFGNKVRFKSPARVLDEFKYFIKLGFKDIHIKDSNFTTDLDRSKEICKLLLDNKIKIPWNLLTGIRAKDIDREFIGLAKRSGCYSIAFGIESSNKKILKNVNKLQDLDDLKKKVKMVSKSRIQTIGFFMIGLPGETVDTIKNTIKFSKELALDFVKVTIAMPYPSSKLFFEYEKKGYIISRNWSDYTSHLGKIVYKHPNISQKEMNEYYKKFYKGYYLRIKYILWKTYIDFLRGELINTVKMFFKVYVTKN